MYVRPLYCCYMITSLYSFRAAHQYCSSFRLQKLSVEFVLAAVCILIGLSCQSLPWGALRGICSIHKLLGQAWANPTLVSRLFPAYASPVVSSCARAVETFTVKSFVFTIQTLFDSPLLAVSPPWLIGRTNEKDCIWSTRAAEQPEGRQARLERKRKCVCDVRAAEQPEATQARLERQQASEQPKARQARLEIQCECIHNWRTAEQPEARNAM